jgi:hypothetical protein
VASATDAAELRDAAATDDAPDSDRVTRGTAAQYSAVLETPGTGLQFVSQHLATKLGELHDDPETPGLFDARNCVVLAYWPGLFDIRQSAGQLPIQAEFDNTIQPPLV